MNRPEPFTIGEPVGRPIRSVVPLRPHRIAGAMADKEMIEAIYLDDAMLDDVLPIIRRRLGETRHVDLDPRVHWTTYPLTIAAVCVALIFVLQLSRSYLAAVL